MLLKKSANKSKKPVPVKGPIKSNKKSGKFQLKIRKSENKTGGEADDEDDDSDVEIEGRQRIANGGSDKPDSGFSRRADTPASGLKMTPRLALQIKMRMKVSLVKTWRRKNRGFWMNLVKDFPLKISRNLTGMEILMKGSRKQLPNPRRKRRARQQRPRLLSSNPSSFLELYRERCLSTSSSGLTVPRTVKN